MGLFHLKMFFGYRLMLDGEWLGRKAEKAEEAERAEKV